MADLPFIEFVCFLFLSLHGLPDLVHLVDAVITCVFIKAIVFVLLVTVVICRHLRFLEASLLECRVGIVLAVQLHPGCRPYIGSQVHLADSIALFLTQYLILTV